MGKSDGAGMERAELKRHLKLAAAEPISVAFALGGDGKAILQMHKRKQGRMLEKDLKDADPDSKNHRWGTATIDPDDPKLVRFMINKAAGGMARRLILALKGTGFNKVKLVLEDGTEEGAEGEAEEADQDEDEARPHAAAAEPDDDTPSTPPASDDDEAEARPLAATAEPDDDTPGTPSASGDDDDRAEPGSIIPALAADAGALKQALTGLVKQMLQVIAADPTRKAALTEMATDAQASLKRGDLQQASAGIDVLRMALDDPSAPAPGADAKTAAPANDPADAMAHPHAPAIAKARMAWVATRQKIESDVDGLHDSFSKALSGHDKADHLTGLFRKRVDTVFDTLDHSLSTTLESVNQARDAAQREKFVQEAHALIQRYQKHIESDETIGMLDNNPFAPIAIKKTMTVTLSALSKAIR